jgi:hypothetical protein
MKKFGCDDGMLWRQQFNPFLELRWTKINTTQLVLLIMAWVSHWLMGSDCWLWETHMLAWVK